MKDLIHIPIEFFYGLFAVAGGIARYLNGYANGQKFSMGIFLASAFVAGFSGYMFALLGDSMHLPLPMPHILAGVGGFFGEQTMKLILEYVSKRTQ